MTCDLKDPAIVEAYEEIISGGPTNWMLMGYRDTRDVITLYSKGDNGLDELRTKIEDEVLYGFAQIDDYFLFVTYMSEQVSGVRRARAMVHGRAVAALLKKHNVQISATSTGELSEATVRTLLRQKMGDVDQPAEQPASASPPTSNGSATARTPSPPAPSPPTSAPAPQPEPEAAPAPAPVPKPMPVPPISHIAPTTVTVTAEVDEAKLQKEQQLKQQEEAERVRREQLQRKMLQAEKTGSGNQHSGYITVQGGGCYFWKRRFFIVKGNTMFLYRDETEKLPVASLELTGVIKSVEDAQAEVLIPNSFKVEFTTAAEPFFFFADDKEQRDAAMRSIQKCA